MKPLPWLTLLACVAGILRAAEPLPFSVDQEMSARWAASGVTPAPPSDDATFLRRVTLDLTGRIPTAAAVLAFITDDAPDRRARAVDQLLSSPAYAEYQADRLLALLVGRADRLPQPLRPALLRHLQDAMAHSTPYDQLVWSLLTAEGDLEKSPQGAFLVAHARGGAGYTEVTAATANVFLGVQLQCAQCHDHPYDDRYRQEDFHALGAFFARTRAQRSKEEMGKSFVVVDVARGTAKMTPPEGPEVRVQPRFLGRDIPPLPNETRRETLARAVTTSDLFAKTVVNRAWQELFGRALVHPWNDLGGEHDKAHPPLLVNLSRAFVEHHHDLRWLHRTLVLSRAYGLSGAGADVARGRALEAQFAAAPVRPLDPFQLLESTLLATGVADAVREKAGEEKAAQRREQVYRELTFVFGDDEMTEVDTFNGNVVQALVTFNGELVNRGARANPLHVLGKIVDTHRDNRTRVEQMYLSTLSRLPTAEEQAAAEALLSGARKPRPLLEDLYFSLLASTEFATNH